MNPAHPDALGPERIAPGEAPGGLIVETYALTGERLRRSTVFLETAELTAWSDAALTALDPRSAPGIVLVVFDGDTGERWGYAEWERFREHEARS